MRFPLESAAALLMSVLIIFPLYLIGRKHPKLSGGILSVIFWIMAAFLVLVFSAAIIGVILLIVNSIFNIR